MIERWFPRPPFSLTGVACVFGQTSRRFLSDEAATASPRNQKYFLSSRHRTWRFATSDRIEVISRSTGYLPIPLITVINIVRSLYSARQKSELLTSQQGYLSIAMIYSTLMCSIHWDFPTSFFGHNKHEITLTVDIIMSDILCYCVIL